MALNELEVMQRLVATEERAKSNTHQIEEIKPVVQGIYRLNESMVEMVGEMKHTNENVCEIKDDMGKLSDKVEAIEKEPATKWKDAVKLVATGLISAAVGAVAHGLWPT